MENGRLQVRVLIIGGGINLDQELKSRLKFEEHLLLSGSESFNSRRPRPENINKNLLINLGLLSSVTSHAFETRSHIVR